MLNPKEDLNYELLESVVSIGKPVVIKDMRKKKSFSLEFLLSDMDESLDVLSPDPKTKVEANRDIKLTMKQNEFSFVMISENPNQYDLSPLGDYILVKLTNSEGGSDLGFRVNIMAVNKSVTLLEFNEELPYEEVYLSKHEEVKFKLKSNDYEVVEVTTQTGLVQMHMLITNAVSAVETLMDNEMFGKIVDVNKLFKMKKFAVDLRNNELELYYSNYLQDIKKATETFPGNALSIMVIREK